MNKNLAFTLAEVLITLAIIGVVAAITIPAVVTKVTKDQYVTSLKKAFNTLKQVEREAIREHGAMENWELSHDAKTDFNRYFKSHFDIIKDCGLMSEGNSSSPECMAHGYRYLVAAAGIADAGSGMPDTYRIMTPDGLAFGYHSLVGELPSTDLRKANFVVDVNGVKKPNTWGRDVFVFNIFFDKNGIKPAGAYDQTGLPIPSSQVDRDCANDNTGMSCAAKVLAEGAMNY